MTEKRKKFADYYVELGNGTDAYIKAGYKVSSRDIARKEAYKILTKPDVQKYIGERNKSLESSRIADMTEVKEFWTTTLRDDEADRKDRLKASEYIAKTNGAFIDNMNLGNKDGKPFEVTTLTPEERDKRIEELKKKLIT